MAATPIKNPLQGMVLHIEWMDGVKCSLVIDEYDVDRSIAIKDPEGVIHCFPLNNIREYTVEERR